MALYNNILIKFKLLFNPSRLFLLLLVIFAIFNSFSSLNKSNFQINSEFIEARIIYKKSSSNFSNLYVGMVRNNLFHFDSNISTLEGKKLLFKTKYEPYGLNNEGFKRYYKTKGINGIFKVKDIIWAKCDTICTYIKNVLTIKQSYRTKFNYTFCSKALYNFFSYFKTYDCSLYSNISIALLLGDTSNLDQEFKDQTKKIGVYHIFSFSGFQIVLIFTWLEFIFQKLIAISKKISLPLIISFIFLIIINVGFEIPVIRSSISIIIQVILLTYFGRSISSTRSLILSGLIISIFNPLIIFNISFQLSFMATLGVIIGGYVSHVIMSTSHFIQKIKEYVFPTIFSTLLTFPIISSFGEQSSFFIIIFSNLIITFFLPIITIFLLAIHVPIIGQIGELIITTFYLMIEVYVNLTR